MGTRSLTYVYSDKTPVVCMYRQFDGYPSGHGAELSEFLNGFEIVNGFAAVKPKLANSMGCLAAQMIAHFKVGVGGFYLEPVELVKIVVRIMSIMFTKIQSQFLILTEVKFLLVLGKNSTIFA
jgi:hypothetical protein